MTDDEIILINPPKKKRTTKLRVINRGNNRYDVAGKLIQLGRAIRDGKFGDVTDVVVGVREIRKGGGVSCDAFHFGRGDAAAAHHTWALTKTVMGE